MRGGCSSAWPESAWEAGLGMSVGGDYSVAMTMGRRRNLSPDSRGSREAVRI